MEYGIYKLEFTTDVHFGAGLLSGSEISFCADTLFSALFIEGMKTGRAQQFYEEAKAGNILFSDALPYMGDRYFLPKPMLYVEPKDKGNSTVKKKFKKLGYVPSDQLSAYLAGTMNPDTADLKDLGSGGSQIMAAIRSGEEDTKPFSVGTYRFAPGNGLYVIGAFQKESCGELLEELFESLSYTGIGGKRASGKGKFRLKIGKHTDGLKKLLTGNASRYMLLSCALPMDEELEYALEGASYLLQKRSGFIDSETYAEEQQKKKDLYVFRAGSCFVHPFAGDIYDVSDGGSHPVYRYARAMFLGV